MTFAKDISELLTTSKLKRVTCPISNLKFLRHLPR